MLVQVYVDDIIFGSTKKSLYVEFEALMHKRFQMSSMRELTFFLGLQVKQSEEGIFISQDKYVAEILKKFDFSSVKTASTPIETQKPLVKDEVAADVDFHLYRFMIRSLMYLTASRPDIMFAVCACSRGSLFDLEAYSISDYAGANLDRISTTREYVAAAHCYRQVLWIQNQLLDYGFNFLNTKIYIDNKSTIYIIKNPSEASMDLAMRLMITIGFLMTEENAEFHQILDFLSTCSLNYALTAMVISESSVRSDLLFNDEDVEMSRDVLIVGSTMRIPLLYRGEYSQWVERFMNYLEEQTNGEAMITLKDKSMWSDQEKRVQKINHLARSLLVQGLPNDIYSLIDSNKTAKNLWDALAR
nr:hypothetical protein [Tanacetum cinerariifolium]